MSTIFIQTSRGLSGLGSSRDAEGNIYPGAGPGTADALARGAITSGFVPDPALVRASSGAGLAVSGLIGYGSYRLFKAKRPVLGTIVGLIAAIGVPGGIYGLATGKLPGTV